VTKNRAAEEYEKLHQLSYQARLCDSITQILDWDRETYMPAMAASIRSEQLELLAGLSHERKTSKQYKEALSQLIDIESGAIRSHAEELPAKQIAALKRWRHDFVRAVKLPKSFVQTFAKITSQAINVWAIAKEQNAFLKFSPYLDRIVAMVRQRAELIGYENHPYDVLLEDYEPDITTEEVSQLFDRVGNHITALLGTIAKGKKVDDRLLHGQFPIEKQKEVNEFILKQIGFDFQKGRLDTSSHPFSSASHPTDSRITTRYDEKAFFNALSSTLHEAGHSFYEVGLPIKEYGSPLGDALSLGMHESQSRWWENLIGRSKPFWSHFLPLLQNTFKSLSNVSLNDFYSAINRVQPSLIRVDADEVTYGLHIILRFQIERDLIEGCMGVREIPEVWAEKMQSLLGVTPKNDREGCLQDIHWAMGSFAYFPTYTLGNLYASHLFLGFEKGFPDWEARIKAGDFAFMLGWLHDNVHRYGRQYSPQELLKKVTGKKFSEKAYLDYLTKKYVGEG
jgi:carboxypeptidase Taq